jgi:hypothetical protein
MQQKAARAEHRNIRNAASAAMWKNTEKSLLRLAFLPCEFQPNQNAPVTSDKLGLKTAFSKKA